MSISTRNTKPTPMSICTRNSRFPQKQLYNVQSKPDEVIEQEFEYSEPEYSEEKNISIPEEYEDIYEKDERSIGNLRNLDLNSVKIKSKLPYIYLPKINCLIPISKSIKSNIEINFSERIRVKSISETEISAPQIENAKFKLTKNIRTSHMNSAEKCEILKLCSKFKNIFYNENWDFSFSNTVKHKIRTKDDEPVHVKSFRHPHSMKTIIQKQIQKLR